MKPKKTFLKMRSQAWVGVICMICISLMNAVVNAQTCTGPLTPGDVYSSAGSSLCVGETTTLTLQNNYAGNGATYQWMRNGVAISGATNETYLATIITPGFGSGNTFNCQLTCAPYNGSSNSLQLTAISAPSVSISGSTSSLNCGQSRSLTANGASSYIWQPGNLSGAIAVVTPLFSTTYTVTGTNANGCTSTATFTIDVNVNVNISGSGTAINCGVSRSLSASGANSFIWQPGSLTGSSITVTPLTTTTYTVTGTTAGGCTATSTKTIVVNPNTLDISGSTAALNCGQSRSLSANGADSYVWQPGALVGANITVTPLTTTTYTVTGTNTNGCSATAIRTVVVNPIIVNISGSSGTLSCGQSVNLSASGTNTYSWQPGSFTGSNAILTPLTTTTYTVTGTTAAGCTATATRLVNVNSISVNISGLTAPIVCGASKSLSASGANSYVWQPGSLTGSSISVNPLTTTTYTVTGTTAAGCVGTDTRTVTVTPIFVSISGSTTQINCGQSVSYTASGASSYVWQPGSITGANVVLTPNVNTTYTVIGTNAAGCSNSATREILVNPNGVTTISETACNTYTWVVSGLTYTTGGTYIHTYTNAQGCLITATLNLTITPGTTSSTTASSCDSYTWAVNNTTYTASGVYTDIVGCHTSTLNLTITPSTATSSTISACETYTWPFNSTTYTASGTYTAIVGCQTSTLNLTITPSTTSSTIASACDSYTWAVNNTTYTASGVYTDIVGCHSSTLNLTITIGTTSSTTASSCDSYTWAVNNTTYTVSGVYTDIVGCHTSTLNLTITPSTTSSTTASACDSYTWSVNNMTYTASGTYTYVSGCHTETLDLTITPSTLNITTASACGSYTWACNGQTYATSGTYTCTSLTASGCVHTDSLTLTITYTGQPCTAPTSVSLSAITESSVSISWVSGGTETSWQLEYGYAGTPIDSGTKLIVNTNSFVLHNLDCDTAYVVYLRANCNVNGLSCSAGPFAFTTSACSNIEPNFYAIDSSYQAYFAANPDTTADGSYVRYLRWRHFWKDKVNNGSQQSNTGSFTAYNLAIANAQNNICQNTSTPQWSLLGPTSLPTHNIGKITCVVQHPSSPNILYAGTPNSGLWKSIDNGVTWSNITDNIGLPVFGIHDVILKAGSPETIFIATGHGGFGGGALNSYGLGVWWSQNGGSSWTQISHPVINGKWVRKLIKDPNDNNKLYFVMEDNVTRKQTLGEMGYYSNSWFLSYGQIPFEPNEVITDLEVDPLNSNTLFISTRFAYPDQSKYCRILKVVKIGNSYSVYPISNISTNNLIVLATTPADPTNLYALIKTGTSETLQSFDIPNNTWTTIASGVADITFGIFGGLSEWHNPFEISKTNANIMYAGGTQMARSVNGGVTWCTISPYFQYNSGDPVGHADINSIHISNYDNNVVLVGSDGGGMQSSGTTSSCGNIIFADKNGSGLAITQFYGIGSSNINTNKIFGGSQDNTSFLYNAPSWQRKLAGDGGRSRIDPLNPDILYGWVNPTLVKIVGTSESYLPSPEGWNWKLDMPFELSPQNEPFLYRGYQNLFKQSTTAPYGFTPLSSLPSNLPSIGAIAVDPTNSNTIYFSLDYPTWSSTPQGNLNRFFKVTNANSTPLVTDITINFQPFRFAAITDIEIDPDDPSHLWVSMNGLWEYQGVPQNRVLESKDGGASWNDYSTGLTQFPVHVLAYDKNTKTLYAGTDVGVYYRSCCTSQWECYNNSMPICIVNDLNIVRTGSYQKLRAATWGRGVWEADLVPYCGPNLSVTKTNAICYGGTGSIIVNSTGGGGPFTLKVIRPSTGQIIASYTNITNPYTINNAYAGNYIVEVCNSNGCCKSINVTITQPKLKVTDFSYPKWLCKNVTYYDFADAIPTGGTFTCLEYPACVTPGGRLYPSNVPFTSLIEIVRGYKNITIRYTTACKVRDHVITIKRCPDPTAGPCQNCDVNNKAGANIVKLGDMGSNWGPTIPERVISSFRTDLKAPTAEELFIFGIDFDLCSSKRFNIVYSSGTTCFLFRDVNHYTSESHHYMLINGFRNKQIAKTGGLVWGQDVAVEKNRKYKFCFTMNTEIKKRDKKNPSLKVIVRYDAGASGMTEHIIFQQSDISTSGWETKYGTWTAPSNCPSKVSLEIIQTEGYILDCVYGIDDITFYGCYPANNPSGIGPIVKREQAVIGGGSVNSGDPITLSVNPNNLFMNGSTNIINYLWLPGGQTTSSITVSPTSTTTYSLIVSNASAEYPSDVFTDTSTFTVNVTPIIHKKEDISCHGGSDGSIEVEPKFGIEPYTYQWSNGATEPDIDSLIAGFYTVTVTDSNSLSNTEVIEVKEPEIISVNATIKLPCDTNSSGSISPIVTGGSGFYDYVWNNTDTLEDLYNISSGSYSLTVTDSKGCEHNEVFQITSTICEPIQCDSISAYSNIYFAEIDDTTSLNSELSNSCTCGQGTYCLTTNASLKCSSFDTIKHSGGDGKIMVIEGSNVSHKKIWSSIVNGIAGTRYLLSSNIYMNVDSGSTPPVLEYKVNGIVIKSIDSTDIDLNGWYTVNQTYIPLVTGNLEFSIEQANTGGAYAIDDINIAQCKPITYPVSTYAVSPVCAGTISDSIEVFPTGDFPPFGVYWEDDEYGVKRAGINAGQMGYVLIDNNGNQFIDTVIVPQLPTTHDTISVTANGPYTWPVNGITYTTTGFYTHSFTNVNDCDSVLTLDLVINTVFPTLGTYPSTTLISGTNTTISPSTAPTNTLSAVAYTNTNFTGILVVNPTTGVITITDAKQAGTYVVTVQAFGTGNLTSSTTFTLTVTNPICSDGLFISKPDALIGGSPRHIAVGDFNNDGKQDLATANFAYGTISIRLGDGVGGFIGTSDMNPGGFPGYIAIGDFNGDGKQDFATPSYFDNVVWVYLGDGLGGFNYLSNVAVGTNPLRMAIGDFNADGKQDIACSNIGSNNVSIRLGDGLGGFSGTTNVSLASIINPGELAIADFNNDGKQDIACTINGNGTVSILIGDGTGNFSLNGNINTGASPNAIAIGDFNGDGNQDFVTSNYNNGSEPVSVRLGNGSGGFSNGGAVLVAGFPRSITVGDFNGDGKLDIATASVPYDVISIRYGDGLGNFSGSLNLPVGDAPYTIAVGDFDGDGKHDISSINPNDNTVSIRLGSGAEINVKGNNVTIVDGDINPSTTDHTDFGNVSNNLVRAFTIQNTGNTNLTINSINMNGQDASLFIVGGITLPTTIAANSSATFTITFTPTTVGLKTATVNISSNDCDEAVYDFAVRGMLAVSNTLNVKCYLEGLYIGGGMMTPALMNQGVGTNATVADTITVELRNSTAPYALADSTNTILNTNGTATCTFQASGDYYIVVKHRNALQTWSADPVTIGSTLITYNFSDFANKAYGSNQIEIEPGVWAIYSGDIVIDENIDLLDLGDLETDINNFIFGYYATDINGDGNVDLLDIPVVEANINNFIFSAHP